MKKVITGTIFALWAVAGYYIGVAAAGDHNVSDEPVGVMVVEEEYGVVTVPEKQHATKDHNTDKHKMMPKNHNSSTADNGASNAGGMMVEEEISETESD